MVYRVPRQACRVGVSVVVLWAVCGSAWGWTAAVNVSNQPAGSRAFGPTLAAGPGSTLHLAWPGGPDPSTGWSVWYQSYSGGWSGATALSTPNANRPDLAIDASNNLHITYEDDGEDDIWYRKRTGASWGAPVNLRTGGRSISPHIAVNAAADRILVAWHEDFQTGGEWDIFTNVYQSGTWLGLTNISTDGALSSEPRVAVDASNSFHVIWQSDGQEVWYRKRDAAGVWGAKTRLDHTGERSGVGDIAVGADGLVHVVYSEDDTVGWEVWYRYFNGSSWSTPVNICNHAGTSDDIGATITVDGANRLYAVWHDYSAIYYTSAASATSSWAPRTSIVSGKYLATDPDIVVDANWVAHAVWQSRPTSGDNWNIYYASQTIGAPPATGTLTGTVKDQFGLNVPNALVSAGVYAGVANNSGAYSFPVAVGTYTASASKEYFTTQNIPNVTLTAGQTTTVNFTLTSQPPAPVPVFTATPSNQKNQLHWTNPGSGQFGGTRIRYRIDQTPTGPSDGTLVGDFTGSPGSTGSYTHTGLTNGVTYFYAAFAYDNYAVRSYAAGTATTGVPALQCDTDSDGDVDLADFGKFQACLSGSAVTQTNPACAWAKLDGDDDVDGDDLIKVVGCLSGAGLPANPACLN